MAANINPDSIAIPLCKVFAFFLTIGYFLYNVNKYYVESCCQFDIFCNKFYKQHRCNQPMIEINRSWNPNLIFGVFCVLAVALWIYKSLVICLGSFARSKSRKKRGGGTLSFCGPKKNMPHYFPSSVNLYKYREWLPFSAVTARLLASFQNMLVSQPLL